MLIAPMQLVGVAGMVVIFHHSVEYLACAALQNIHLFSKYLMNAPDVLGSILGVGDTEVNKIGKNSCLSEAFILVGKNRR
jgi:hypothetical protein